MTDESLHVERRGLEGWHIRREVNIGHMLTTLSIAAGLVIWAIRMDGRVTTGEVVNERQDRAIVEMNNVINQNLDVIRSDVREIRDAIIRKQ